MGRHDQRVAGHYEQTLGHVDEVDLARSLATVVGSLAGLEVRGLVHRPGRVPFADLRSLARSDRVSDFDASRIDLSALLCHVQVAAEAELAVWDTLDHGRIALTIDVALQRDATHLTLGGDSCGCHTDQGLQTLQRPWHDPIVLHSTDLPVGQPLRVTRMTATTHDALVGDHR